ncbi:hypothetical protein COW38_01440 [Candidatus Collierbacteria bacterium CG17_big_fil_post_rev_8_21_14_2_50_45_7]|uniref:Uncharacterized protein n=1 Tax=Candidatus Collierbacteria bacterium CG17_big_fil_post_rev_8_21_14_2_50_45_7 TaxID=1974536 RepID=A0A2M7FQV7_9BACT|nr:MAG: hypothetical protein COW38_01440 [Candidatus Collierbacteria bacterium CG17_big_fil_post_rev_8_21_14_2_50_45_7]
MPIETTSAVVKTKADEEGGEKNMATSGTEGPDWSSVPKDEIVVEIRDPETYQLLGLTMQVMKESDELLRIVTNPILRSGR